VERTQLKIRLPSDAKAFIEAQPIMEYVSPRGLYVDPAYQRSIGERGLKQIRRIIENFDWSKFKLPTCCYAENFAGGTVLFVLDGQHTAIA
jgi:hypothetical protein